MRAAGMLWRHIYLAAVLGTPAAALAAAQAQAPAQAQPAVLVELFTSEGCSSCPPADQLLREWNGKHTADGRLIVGISEHVTYWNNLGWTDPYSSDIYTARQSDYGRRFHLDSVYTPQMVIDGRTQIVGGDQAGLQEALRSSAGSAALPLRILSVDRTGQALSVRFSYGDLPGGHPVDIFAAVADDADRSHVQRGENAGRSLDHVAVARSFMQVATLHGAAHGSGTETVQVELPASVREQPTAGHHLILFAQTPGLGSVLGAAVRELQL